MYTGLDIKNLRQKLGKTQMEMAELLKTLSSDNANSPSVQTIRYWEQRPDNHIKEKHNSIIKSAINYTIEREEKGNEQMVKSDFVSKVKSNLAKIPFLREAVQMYFFTKDPQADVTAKVIAISALAYFILPFDAIPDFMPVVGYTDDAGVITAALLKLKSDITEKHVREAEEFLDVI